MVPFTVNFNLSRTNTFSFFICLIFYIFFNDCPQTSHKLSKFFLKNVQMDQPFYQFHFSNGVSYRSFCHAPIYIGYLICLRFSSWDLPSGTSWLLLSSLCWIGKTVFGLPDLFWFAPSFWQNSVSSHFSKEGNKQLACLKFTYYFVKPD